MMQMISSHTAIGVTVKTYKSAFDMVLKNLQKMAECILIEEFSFFVCVFVCFFTGSKEESSTCGLFALCTLDGKMGILNTYNSHLHISVEKSVLFYQLEQAG